MKNRGLPPFCDTLAVFTLVILAGIFSLPGPAWTALIFLDDYEKEALNADITEIFRTPTVGPSGSAAWYHAVGNLVILPSARVVNHLDVKLVRVEVPIGCAIDYIEHLGVPYSGRVFYISWDIEVSKINGGWGMFLIRFPTTDTDGMQVLFGFLDDGRVIRFSGKPAIETLVPVGTFRAGTRYAVRFAYDLIAKHYSATLNGVQVVAREPIPDYFDLTAFDRFGFDINQGQGLPDLPHPPQGNIYHVDNIRLEVGGSIWLPLILKGH
jgi:hypothetical protein